MDILGTSNLFYIYDTSNYLLINGMCVLISTHIFKTLLYRFYM